MCLGVPCRLQSCSKGGQDIMCCKAALKGWPRRRKTGVSGSEAWHSGGAGANWQSEDEARTRSVHSASTFLCTLDGPLALNCTVEGEHCAGGLGPGRPRQQRGVAAAAPRAWADQIRGLRAAAGCCGLLRAAVSARQAELRLAAPLLQRCCHSSSCSTHGSRSCWCCRWFWCSSCRWRRPARTTPRAAGQTTRRHGPRRHSGCWSWLPRTSETTGGWCAATAPLLHPPRLPRQRPGRSCRSGAHSQLRCGYPGSTGPAEE